MCAMVWNIFQNKLTMKMGSTAVPSYFSSTVYIGKFLLSLHIYKRLRADAHAGKMHDDGQNHIL